MLEQQMKEQQMKEQQIRKEIMLEQQMKEKIRTEEETNSFQNKQINNHLNNDNTNITNINDTNDLIVSEIYNNNDKNDDINNINEMKLQIQKELDENNEILNNKIINFNKIVEETKKDLEEQSKILNQKEQKLKDKENQIVLLEQNIQTKNNIMYDTIFNYFNKSDENNYLTKNIIIDSRMRNYTQYENSANYSISLNEPINNVHSIEIYNYNIKDAPFIINNNNNCFELSDNTNSYDIYITNNNYSPSELATEIEHSMNSVSDSKYTVKYDNIDFIISNNDTIEFTLQFDKSSFNNIIGFKQHMYSGDTKYTSDTYPYLHNESYCNLQINNNSVGTIFYNEQTYLKYEFNSNEESIDNINITLTDYNNKICDLTHTENVFYVKFNYTNLK